MHQGDAASHLAPRIAEGLRDNGIDVVLNCGGGSFKSQMKKADGSGAAFAVIIGDDEAAAGQVSLKHLRTVDGKPGEQKRVGVDDVADEIMNSSMDWEE